MSDEATLVAKVLEDARIQEKTRAGSADGTKDGIAVHVEWRRSNRLSVWSVEAKGAGPNVLALVRQRDGGDEGAIASGAIEEVKTGDATFDRKWLVEGAPKARTKEIFDDDVRRTIVGTGKMVLEVDGGRVVAGMNGTHFTAEDVVRGIEAVVATRRRVIELAQERPDDPKTKSADDEAIAALRTKQEKIWARASWTSRLGMLFLVSVLVIAVSAGVFYGCGINVLFEKR